MPRATPSRCGELVVLAMATLCLGGCYRAGTQRLPVLTYETERVQTGSVPERTVEETIVAGPLAAPSGRVSVAPVTAAADADARAAGVERAIRLRLEEEGMELVPPDAEPPPDWILVAEIEPIAGEAVSLRVVIRRPGERDRRLGEPLAASTPEEIADTIAGWTQPRTARREVEQEVPWYSLRRRAVVRYQEVETLDFSGRFVLGTGVETRVHPTVLSLHVLLIVGIQLEGAGGAPDHLVTIAPAIAYPAGQPCGSPDVTGGLRVQYEARFPVEEHFYVGPQLALGGLYVDSPVCEGGFEGRSNDSLDYASVGAVAGLDVGSLTLGLIGRVGFGYVSEDFSDEASALVDLGTQMTFAF